MAFYTINQLCLSERLTHAFCADVSDETVFGAKFWQKYHEDGGMNIELKINGVEVDYPQFVTEFLARQQAAFNEKVRAAALTMFEQVVFDFNNFVQNYNRDEL